MDLERRFSHKEAEKILRIALDRKYDLQKSEMESRQGMSLAQLTETANEVNISADDLKFGIQAYQDGRARNRKRLKIFGGILAAVLAVGALVKSGSSLDERYKRENQYVDAIATKVEDKTLPGTGARCDLNGDYTLEFKIKNREYIANIVDGFYCTDGQDFRALKATIKEGSLLGIKQGALDLMKGTYGTVVATNIVVKKR